MMKTMTIFSVVFAAVAALAGVRDDPGATRKLIALGWDTGSRTIGEIAAHADQIAAMGFDGVEAGLKVADLKEKGATVGWRSPVYGTNEFTRLEELPRAIEELKALNRTSLKDNFVGMCLFFDKWHSFAEEDFWKGAYRRVRIFAKAAKESGCRGVFIDTEDYPHCGQFYHIPRFTELDGAAEARFARQRGREFMAAMMDEYPDMDILTTWLLSNQSRKAYQDSYNGPRDHAEGGDLFIPFMQGLVEGLKPEATLIDGDEAGYWCKAQYRDFFYDYHAIRHLAMGLMPPELRGKYNDQVRAAFGLYFDSYTLPEKNWWSMPAVDGSRLKAYELNLRQAFEATDRYVWIWGEHFSYAKWTNCVSRTNIYPIWESQLPGVSLMQRFIKDPKGTGEALWREARKADTSRTIPLGSGGTNGLKIVTGRERKDGFTPKWEYVAEGHAGRPGMKQSGTFGGKIEFPGYGKLDKEYGAVYRASVWFKVSTEGKYKLDPEFKCVRVTRNHPIWNGGGGQWFKHDEGNGAVTVTAGAPDRDGWREAVIYFRADACDWQIFFSAGCGRRLWENEWVIVSDPQLVMISPPNAAFAEAVSGDGEL